MKSGRTLLPSRLRWIDETNRGDHPFLREEDQCLFFGEYFAGKGYRGGNTNRLIFNFKCPLPANAGRLQWKERAISTVATSLRNVFSREGAEQLTWVPIPPSKVLNHAEYDDRLLRTLSTAFKGYDVDVRSLLRQTASTDADHMSGDRLTSEALHAVLEVDQALLLARPLRQIIVLFDDVLTTGKHFKCCERRLREAVPSGAQIMGIFIARRILSHPFDGLTDLTQS